MPRVSGIDRQSSKPVSVFFAKNARSLRLQLKTREPEYDSQGRQTRVPVSVTAQFKDGFYRTNKPEEIKAIKESYAFEDGQVVDFLALQEEAREKKADELTEMIAKDPTLADSVVKRLQPKKGAKRTQKDS